MNDGSLTLVIKRKFFLHLL